MNKSGFLLINKPPGPTSHDIVNQLRKITGIKKIGHAGTLDPFAEGLLVLAIGRESTREISKFVKLDKEYIATLKLGFVSDTYDKTGKINEGRKSIQPSTEEIEKVLKTFINETEQLPPMFSAKKIKGKKLYELARKGIEIERKPHKITIYNIEILDYDFPLLKIKVKCSSGTYIRTLAHDAGQMFGCGAYLERLQRTAIGDLKIEDALDIKKLTHDNWSEFLFQKS